MQREELSDSRNRQAAETKEAQNEDQSDLAAAARAGHATPLSKCRVTSRIINILAVSATANTNDADFFVHSAPPPFL
jgi:hypothetical protein